MEGFRFGIYVSVIFFVSFHFEHVTAVKQMSAVILQVQSVPNGVSSAKFKECAFHLMKSSDSSFHSLQEVNLHYIYKEVNIGDKFDFVFQMLKSDTLTVVFANTAYTEVALRFNNNSTHLRLSALGDSITNERKTLASPFKYSQIYKISFELLEYHWKRDRDNAA